MRKFDFDEFRAFSIFNLPCLGTGRRGSGKHTPATIPLDHSELFITAEIGQLSRTEGNEDKPQIGQTTSPEPRRYLVQNVPAVSDSAVLYLTAVFLYQTAVMFS